MTKTHGVRVPDTQRYADRVKPAELGRKFWMSEYRGGKRIRSDYEVRASCQGKRGAWFCITHRTSFRSQFDKDLHISNGLQHELSWVCVEHGPEVP